MSEPSTTSKARAARGRDDAIPAGVKTLAYPIFVHRPF
jgi:hypothetical protein